MLTSRCLSVPLALAVASLLGVSGCAGGLDPGTPSPQPQPQPQPQQPAAPPSNTGWVCTTATCGGKCIDNVCYPKDYEPPSNSTPPPSSPGSTPPPSTGNCPQASDVIGSYEGTIDGNIKSVIDVQVVGKVTFSVVDDGNGGLKIDSGQVFGKALGINFSLPMNGTVACGKLSGKGSGTLVGVAVDGTFTATFTAAGKKFDSGSWSGTAPSNGSTGGGSWSAAQL